MSNQNWLNRKVICNIEDGTTGYGTVVTCDKDRIVIYWTDTNEDDEFTIAQFQNNLKRGIIQFVD